MTKFVCTNCNYKFEALEKPRSCPYCNQNDVEQEKSASDLLNEVKETLEE
jgi:rubrerythrin